jgi:predicted TIM-barrel enzyme
MNNLETSYMGIPLRSPVILGASELSTNNDTLKRAEDAGVAAIVYKSLFEEQVQLENLQHDEMLEEYNDIHAEMITLHPEIERSEIEHFLHVLRKAKESVSVPVIASLNAVNKSTWIKYAKLIEETGVDGIELNLYQTPTRFDRDGVAIESFQADIVSSVKDRLSIPVGVKLSSDYTNILNFAQQLDEAGVDGLVLFNAFFQPDIDIEKEKHRKSYNFSRRGDIVNDDLQEELNKRLEMAGIEIVEARINYLAYAPEIAAVMLRRQQAEAIIAAREKIVEGAVTMVKMALDKIEDEDIVELDADKKAAMVSNLLVVLCADESAQPVLNTGSLYQ